MAPAQNEPLRNPRGLFLRSERLIAASYGLDTLLLLLFVDAGVAPAWLPLAYAAVALGICGLFYGLIRSGWSERFADSNLTLAQLAAAVGLQLAFIVLAPPMSLYFVTVLFVIFGFGSLRLRVRDAAVAWLATGAALSAIVYMVPDVFLVPHATPLQRTLVGVSILLTLARCTMLGLYGSRLRILLGRRHEAVKASLEASEADRTRTSVLLHEDISQDLAGISLLLSAYAARLGRDAAAGTAPAASDIAEATAQLRSTIEKTRQVAAASRRVVEPLRPLRRGAR